MKKNWLILLLMMFVIPIAGELKFYPFDSTFRISFCVPIFFLLLMWLRHIPLIVAGFGVGLSIVCFRIGIASTFDPHFVFQEAILLQIPALFYYLTYAWLFDVTNMSDMKYSPMVMGIYCIFIEFTSSVVELAYRAISLHETLHWLMFLEILLIAIIRSFFALSFFFIVKLREAEVLAKEKTSQNEQMLLLISTLYQESMHLKKTLHNAETITSQCYKIYRTLRETAPEDLQQDQLAKAMLVISGQVHDIKKDNQKIVAGLNKLIQNEQPIDFMSLPELGQLIIDTNRKYAESLNKLISFELQIDNEALESLPPLHIFTLLSLINNLVVNAVEAIEDTGHITLVMAYRHDELVFEVTDTGSGIQPKQAKLIFEAGYTSKYDAKGNPSTGIGLTYVKELVAQLKGRLDFSSNLQTQKTNFTLYLPIKHLTQVHGINTTEASYD